MSDRHHAAEQFVGECIIKCVQVILNARVSQTPTPRSAALTKPNRWFQLEVEEVPEVRPFLEQPCRFDPTKAVEVEVYCGPAGRPEVVLVERWRVSLDSSWPLRPNASPTPHPRLVNSGSSSSGGSGGGRLVGEDGALYKRLTLMVRTLCCQLRVLPTHRLLRAYKRQPISAWRMSCRVVREGALLGGPPASAIPTSPAPGQELTCRWHMAPVPALGGGLKLGVEHITLAAVSALEELVAGCPVLPAAPRIIVHDYLSLKSGAGAAAAQTPPSAPTSSVPTPAPVQRSQHSAPSAAHTAQAAQLNVGSLPNPSFGSGAAGGPNRQQVQEQAFSRAHSQASPAAGPPVLHRNASAHMSTGQQVSSSSLHSPSIISQSPSVRKSWGKRLTAAHPQILDVASLIMQDSHVGGARDATDADGTIRTLSRDAGASGGSRPADATSQGPPALPGSLPDAGPSAARSVSSPSGLSGAGAAAAGDTVGALSKGPSAPVLIPGGQMRVRSFADMHVVYNFPDNPSSGAPGTPRVTRDPSLAGNTPKLASSACAAAIPMHTHGSAPAAPRGMLGQALEAHLARLKATTQATTTAATSSPDPPAHETDVVTSPPVGAGGQAQSGHTPGSGDPAAGGAQGDQLRTNRLLTSTQPAKAGVEVSLLAGVMPQQEAGGGAVPASPTSGGTRHGLPVAPAGAQHVPVPAGGGQSQRGNGWPAAGVSGAGASACVPDSPQLPFAFTPCTQSLAMSNPAHSHMQGRYASGTSIAASPSWSSMRNANTLSQAWPGSMRGGAGAGPGAGTGGLPAPVSSTIISGRDVSGLALARRPSWIEHSARIGRSNSNSGGTSPATEPHSLGSAQRRAGPLPVAPTVLGSSLGRTPPGAYSGARAVPSTPSRGNGFASQQASKRDAGMPKLSPPGVQQGKGPEVWHDRIGAASWLQAPQISRPLVGSRDAGPGGEAARSVAASSIWAGSPGDLPPPWLIAVQTDSNPAEVGDMDGVADGDDLPFLIELGNQDAAALPGAGGCVPSHTSWVENLKHVCAGKAQQAAGGGLDVMTDMHSLMGTTRMSTVLDSPGTGSLGPAGLGSPAHHGGVPQDLGGQGGHVLHLPDRDVAVGLLLAHLHNQSAQGSSASTLDSNKSSAVESEGRESCARDARVPSLEPPITCSAALEQLSELQSRLANLLSPAA